MHERIERSPRIKDIQSSVVRVQLVVFLDCWSANRSSYSVFSFGFCIGNRYGRFYCRKTHCSMYEYSYRYFRCLFFWADDHSSILPTLYTPEHQPQQLLYIARFSQQRAIDEMSDVWHIARVRSTACFCRRGTQQYN